MRSVIPKEPDKQRGLYQRYNVTKADGSEPDPDAVYFVLRLDRGGSDPGWSKLCRGAVMQMMREIAARGGKHTKFAVDTMNLVGSLTEETKKELEERKKLRAKGIDPDSPSDTDDEFEEDDV